MAILGIQSVLRHRLPGAWRHALWLPMLVVLVLPVLPEAPFALFQQKAAKPAPVVEMPFKTVTPSAFEVTIVPTVPASAPAFALAPAAIPALEPAPVPAPKGASKVEYLAIAWLAGACGVLVAGAIGYLRNMRQIRITATAPDRVLQAALTEAAREAGLSRVPGTLISPAVSSPAVTGLLRPILLLPAGFPAGFNPTEARLILLHEFTHLKRLDLPLNWLMCVLQAMHWFNPLLWFAFARMRAAREAACDARVLSIDATDRRADYGGALLKLQCVTPSRALSLGFVGIFERGSEIKSRIREISAHRSGRTAGRVTGAALVTLLMVFGVTKGQQTDDPSAQKKVESENPAEVATENEKVLHELRKAVQDQEAKLEEHRKALALETYHQLEQETLQLESQINSLLKYDSDQLMAYAAGLDLPGNIIKTLHPQYLEAQLKLASLKASGIDGQHPSMQLAQAEVETMKRQLDEAVVNVRATLQAQLDMAKDRLERLNVEKDGAPAAPGDRPEARFIRRKLRFVKVAEILPVAANALKRAQPGHEAGAQPGDAMGGKADKAPKDAATDPATLSSMLVGDTLLVADEITNSLIVQGPPSGLIIVESLLDLIDVSPPVQGGGKEAIQEKLHSIIIPRIDFENVTIEEAIDFLRVRAAELDVKELDPAKKGVNFVIRDPRPAVAGAAAAPPVRELRLRNVPLGTALKYICDSTGLRYTVDDMAVTLSP